MVYPTPNCECLLLKKEKEKEKENVLEFRSVGLGPNLSPREYEDLGAHPTKIFFLKKMKN